LVERVEGGGSLALVPFRFTYYVSMNKGAHVAEWDGKEYRGCSPTADGLGVVVAIDAAALGLGCVRVKREYSVRDASYADGVCDVVSVEELDVELTKGATDAVVVGVSVRLPFDAADVPDVPDVPSAVVVDGVLVVDGVVASRVLSVSYGKVTNNVLSL
jgi:hypothetical protein